MNSLQQKEKTGSTCDKRNVTTYKRGKEKRRISTGYYISVHQTETVDHVIRRVDEVEAHFSRNTRKAKGTVLCGKSEHITENSKNEEEIDTGCTSEDIEISKTIIAENATYTVFDEVIKYARLEIVDTELNCLSKESFDLIELPSFQLDITFRRVFIGVIAENTFSKMLSESSNLRLDDSQVNIFHEQDVKISSFNLYKTVIAQYPNYFPVENLYFSYIPNFIPKIKLLTFISSSSKEILVFNAIFDDDTLEIFRNILIDEKINIIFNKSFGGIYFWQNSITYLPKQFLTSNVFKFTSALTTIDFFANMELTFIHEEVFLDFFGESTFLYFDYCENLKKLPKSIMDIDLRSLDISNTAIEDLEGIDFSGFTNLEYVKTEESPVNLTCEEEESFKEQYGINENVQIRTCT
eukprot:snap_masked-scaffold_17-processed-gene-3.22-mRNA-1 protein AED:1.00 eAED:1.00 QI:0/0/0/0/1/1/4/0/408